MSNEGTIIKGSLCLRGTAGFSPNESFRNSETSLCVAPLSQAAGLGMIRDGYEAYTIWVFVSFLFSVIGDDGEDEDTPSTACEPGLG